MARKSRRRRSRGSRPYHHGNLRPAVIEAALELIEENGIEGLSLRKLGERVGVSRTAPYRHFQSKQGLLLAIAEIGFEKLTRALDHGLKTARADFSARLKALIHAGVWFALGHRTHFAVMTAAGDIAENLSVKWRDSERRALQILERALREGQQKGEAEAGDIAIQARVVWAQIQGMSALVGATDVEAYGGRTTLIARSADVLCSGLVSRSRPASPPVRSEWKSLREDFVRLASERQAPTKAGVEENAGPDIGNGSSHG